MQVALPRILPKLLPSIPGCTKKVHKIFSHIPRSKWRVSKKLLLQVMIDDVHGNLWMFLEVHNVDVEDTPCNVLYCVVEHGP